MAVKFKPLVKAICGREGGKVAVNAAQVSEVLRITLEELAKVPASEALALIEQYACYETRNGASR